MSDLQQGGAKSGAVTADAAKLTADLARIVTAWGRLSPPVRRAIVAMLECTNDTLSSGSPKHGDSANRKDSGTRRERVGLQKARE